MNETKLIQVTVNMAFEDYIDATADGVRRAIINNVVDGLEAEVAFTSNVTERTVDIADIRWSLVQFRVARLLIRWH